MNWNILNIFEGLFSQASKIVDETVTTQEEKLSLKNEMAAIIQEGKNQALKAELEKEKLEIEKQKIQATTINKEIEGSSIQRSWRPITALALVFIVVCNMFIFPLINAFLRNPAFGAVIKEGSNNENFWNLLMLMIGGYTVGRSGEKMFKNFQAGKQIEKIK